MALFHQAAGRLVSLPPVASHHRSCTHVVLVLAIIMIMCSDLLSISHAKPCKCSSSGSDQDQRAYITVNTTLDQIGASLFLTGDSSSLLPYNNASMSRYLGRILPYYKNISYYDLQVFNSSESDSGCLILPLVTQLWENSSHGTNPNEASFQVSFTMSINRSASSNNQQKVGNSLLFTILPDAYRYITPFVIPPTATVTPNVSSKPVTLADSQVSIGITCVDTVNATTYNGTSTWSLTFDFKSTWIEISTQSLETSSSASAFSNYTVWIQYDRDRQLLSVYVTDSGMPKPKNPIVLASAISNITAPSSTFSFFSTMEQLLQLNTWNSTIEVLPGNSDDSTGKWSTATIVSVVLGSSVAMGAGVAATVYLYFNSKYRRWKKDLDQLAKSMQQLPGMPIQVSFSDIHKATNNFHETMKLGRGGFGAVYRCRLPAPVKGEVLEVAVKKFTRDDNRRYEDFLAEVSVINRLRHKNIVPLIGWSYNKGEPLLIYEYMPNGSLDQHLFWGGDQQQNNSPICQWDTRYNIVMDVATGLQYVHHEYEPTVLHRDIKASNIMIDSTFRGRLGDFGLACTVDIGKNSYTERGDLRGTQGFMAYEYLHSGRATRKTDIYAFGVLIVEIVTGKPPLGRYAQFNHITDWVWHLHREGKLLDAVDPVVTNEQFDSSDARRLLLLGLACSSPNPSERPSMMEALHVITKLSPPPDVPLEKPRFMWPPEHESSSLSPYLTTGNTSLERSSLKILVEMAGTRHVSSENTGSSLHHRPMAMIGGHSQEQEDAPLFTTLRSCDLR